MRHRSRALVALFGCLAACTKNESRQAPEQAPPGAPTAGDEDGAATEDGNEGEDDLVLSTSGAPQTVTGPGSALLLAEMNRILAGTRVSTYSHKTRIDEAAGRFEVDCSGLVDYALSRVAPDALETLRSAGAKRPLAKHYVQLFESAAGGQKKGRWRRIDRAADLAPGDVVAWLKPADVVTNNSGHVMIVRAPITVSRGEVAVPIIDSTSVRHGVDDSRYPSKATGIGEGTIHLVVKDGAAPSGYRWSNGKKARDHATLVMLGRLE